MERVRTAGNMNSQASRNRFKKIIQKNKLRKPFSVLSKNQLLEQTKKDEIFGRCLDFKDDPQHSDD